MLLLVTVWCNAIISNEYDVILFFVVKHEKTPPPATPPSKVPPNPLSHTKTVQKPVVKDMKKWVTDHVTGHVTLFRWEGLFYGPGCVYEVYGEPEKLKVDKLSPIMWGRELMQKKNMHKHCLAPSFSLSFFLYLCLSPPSLSPPSPSLSLQIRFSITQ